jgi:hypothetical protein
MSTSAIVSYDDEATKAFWAKCQCGHIWAAAYYPLDMAKFATILMRCTCPKCGERKRITPAKQDNGKLLEEAA